MSKEKVVVVMSGGMDSGVLAAWGKAQGFEVEALSVNYGQRHARELEAAEALCKHLGIPWQVADLTAAAGLFRGSALTGTGDVPHGHYAAESMKATVVPNRNMVLLSLGIALAVQRKADAVWYGAHAGDHTIYPDCRPEFFAAVRQAAALADWHPVKLEAPFIEKTKADIAKLGSMMRFPFEMTWSCYEGWRRHCGKCGTCVERREAFQLAGVVDTTVYA